MSIEIGPVHQCSNFLIECIPKMRDSDSETRYKSAHLLISDASQTFTAAHGSVRWRLSCMSPAPEIENTIPVPVNARSQIEKRLAEGRISWTGPLVLVAGRSAFWLALQSLLALVFLALHRPAPFRTAGQWWPLYANFGDFGCLLCMKYFTRKEGIRLRDLIGPIRMRWGRDAFLGLAILAVAYPCALAGSYLAQVLVYGSPAKTPAAFILQAHALPIWATVYSLTVWWVIQSPTEEMTSTDMCCLGCRASRTHLGRAADRRILGKRATLHVPLHSRLAVCGLSLS